MARKFTQDRKDVISELYLSSCKKGGRLEVVRHDKDSLKWVFCEECSTNPTKDSLNWSYIVCKYNPRRTLVEDEDDEDGGYNEVFDCALEDVPYFRDIYDCEKSLDSDSDSSDSDQTKK